ncbi:MAG: hypothetical protein A2506_12845, partial [Elusimicrobia bacterium RIFOXYD12_FULL_66_9]
MRRVDIKIGFACNNHCKFCVQGDKRERHGPRPLERIRHDLIEARRQGATGIVVTGGEPTVHQTILPTLRMAKALGYETLQIQSNGRTFAYEELCRKLIEAGANQFSPALHGATAEVHDELTCAPGSFAQTTQGIRNLTRLGQTVITNSVITSVNYPQLPDLARLLVSLGVAQYQFAFVHILGTAAANKAWLVPRKSEIMPFVHRGLDVGRAAGVRCMTEAIPYCFMQGYEDCVAERIIPVTRIYDADQTMADYTAYRLNEGKAKGPRCPECTYCAQCEGPWREYVEHVSTSS